MMHNLILKPISVEALTERIALKTIEIIKQNEKHKPPHEPENPQSIDDVVKLTGYTKPTIYGYCQHNEIPYHKKNGRLFFFKSELIDWIKSGRQKTLKEIEADADAYLSNKNKRTE